MSPKKAAIMGRVIKYAEDNIDTDRIMPGRYCHLSEEKDLKPHTLEDLDADFVKKVKPGDVLVVGANFGCGSSREVAPVAIKACGVSCVVAPSFARIFYRNAINIGLPILESREAYDAIQPGANVAIDLGEGVIEDLGSGRSFKAAAFPEYVQGIIREGGLLNFIKTRSRSADGARANA